jgi:hypothetical protein
MSRLLYQLLRAARVVSERGRWPGQNQIHGAPTRPPAAPTGSRPLRWPGQQSIARHQTQGNASAASPLWARVVHSLSSRR